MEPLAWLVPWPQQPTHVVLDHAQTNGMNWAFRFTQAISALAYHSVLAPFAAEIVPEVKRHSV